MGPWPPGGGHGMASKTLFQSIWGRLLPATDARNDEGAPAYAFEPRHALAQYAATGCLNTTFYATDAQQLDAVRALCDQVDPEFIARAAIYARERGFMKDMPAALVRGAVATGSGAARACVPAGHRQRPDAADLRPDRPLRRGRAEVPRVVAEAPSAPLARGVERRGGRRGICWAEPIAGGHPAHGASTAGHGIA